MNDYVKFVLSFVLLRAVVCRSATVVPPQVESAVSTLAQLQQTLPDQPVGAVNEVTQKYTVTRQVPDAINGLPNQLSQASKTTLPAGSQRLDTVIHLVGENTPRQVVEAQPALFQGVMQTAQALPNQAANAAKYTTTYVTRQVAETASQAATSATATLPAQVGQTAGTLSSQAQAENIDPIALTQCVYRALEQNLGRLGPVIYDLITSREGLGENFAPITAYAAQRLGTENIRNGVNTALNLANQVDWSSRVQSLFARIGSLRDNRTGLTLQDAFQVVRNIFDDPQTLTELRQRIRDDATQTATAPISPPEVVNEGRQTRYRVTNSRRNNYY